MSYAGKRPRGEFLAPFMPYHIPPPTAPIEKAPPKSLRITHGLSDEVISNLISGQESPTRSPTNGLRAPYIPLTFNVPCTVGVAPKIFSPSGQAHPPHHVSEQRRVFRRNWV